MGRRSLINEKGSRGILIQLRVKDFSGIFTRGLRSYMRADLHLGFVATCEQISGFTFYRGTRYRLVSD